MSGPAPRPRTGWGWFVGLGIVLMLLGLFAWFNVVGVTLAGTILIGALLLVGGIVQVVHAFMDRAWTGFSLHILTGILYAIAGLLIMAEPARGAIVITILLAAVLIVTGIMRVVMALRHWNMGGAGLLLLGGLISAIVGIALYLTLPWSGLWVLGTLIAVDLIFNGAAWFEFGLALRRSA
jgi:uncharacterized membrane protein HdeD (DUF308 family)